MTGNILQLPVMKMVKPVFIPIVKAKNAYPDKHSSSRVLQIAKYDAFISRNYRYEENGALNKLLNNRYKNSSLAVFFQTIYPKPVK